MASHGSTYEDYEREYQVCLSQIRSYLASSRGSQQQQQSGQQQQLFENECKRLLGEGRKLASAMQGMAEIENDMLRIHTAKQLVERDIDPLGREVQRIIEQNNRTVLFANNNNGTSTTGGYDMRYQQQQQQNNNNNNTGYRPPNFDGTGISSGSYDYDDNANSTMLMGSLLRSSDDLLRESQAILSETEQIGTSTLLQMGQQREQIQNSSSSVEQVQRAATAAGFILKKMSQRALKNRICLYLLISFLSIANVFVLYCIYKKHHNAVNGGK